jgi:hypothetical protein
MHQILDVIHIPLLLFRRRLNRIVETHRMQNMPLTGTPYVGQHPIPTVVILLGKGARAPFSRFHCWCVVYIYLIFNVGPGVKSISTIDGVIRANEELLQELLRGVSNANHNKKYSGPCKKTIIHFKLGRYMYVSTLNRQLTT